MPRWWPSPLERKIAVRYLRGQRGTRNASLQSVVAIGGIAVGVMALIVVLGVMNGLRDDLRDRILVASPHLRILTFGDALRVGDWEMVVSEVQTVEGVVAAAPEVITNTLATNRGGHSELAKVAGLEPGVGTQQVTGIDSVIIEGAFVAGKLPGDSAEANVVLGNRLSQRLQAYPGDLLRLVAPSSVRASQIAGTPTPVYWTVRVSGLFETGMYLYDNEFVIMDRRSAQDFAGLGTDVSAVSVVIEDPWRADEIKIALQSKLGPNYRIDTWQEQNAQLFSALKLEKLGMGLVIFFIMIVAAFNIVGTITMIVNIKTREIGILQAMGLPPKSIGRVFLIQGAIIGLRGTVIGLILGLSTALLVDRSGLIRLDPSVYFIDRLPIHVSPIDVTVVALAAIVLAIVATIHPARHAAQLTPVEAVRAE